MPFEDGVRCHSSFHAVSLSTFFFAEFENRKNEKWNKKSTSINRIEELWLMCADDILLRDNFWFNIPKWTGTVLSVIQQHRYVIGLMSFRILRYSHLFGSALHTCGIYKIKTRTESFNNAHWLAVAVHSFGMAGLRHQSKGIDITGSPLLWRRRGCTFDKQHVLMNRKPMEWIIEPNNNKCN